METGDHKDQGALFPKEDAVWKNPQPGATYILQDTRELPGMSRDAFELVLELIDKSIAKSEAFCFIPVTCLDDFELCRVK